MTSFIPTRRALLTLLGVAPAALTPLHAADLDPVHSTNIPPTADGPDRFIALLRDLDRTLRERQEALTLVDRLHAKVIATSGYPRVRLPATPRRPGVPRTPPRYAADPESIDRALGPGHRHLRRRLRRELARRQHAWATAADRIGLTAAIAAENQTFVAVERATDTLLTTPATSLATIRLKLAVLLAAGQPGPADAASFPWRELHSVLDDLHRLAA